MRHYHRSPVSWPGDWPKQYAAGEFQELCADGICHSYKVEPASDSDLPPDRRMLGRAAWTFFHSTAAYLPETLDEAGKVSDRDNPMHVRCAGMLGN